MAYIYLIVSTIFKSREMKWMANKYNLLNGLCTEWTDRIKL